MHWGNLKGEFSILVSDALALKRETRGMRPTIRLLFDRRQFHNVAERADRLSDSFSQADAKLAQAGNLRGNINDLIAEAASYAIVASARETVRTLIHEIYTDLNDVRTRLNNSLSVVLAVAAILVGVAAMFT